MTKGKIDRVSSIVTNFMYEMANEDVSNFEFAEAIASVIVTLCQGNMAHEDIFLDLISDMVKSMSLLKPDWYSNNCEEK